jgi:hypothetical protein
VLQVSVVAFQPILPIPKLNKLQIKQITVTYRPLTNTLSSTYQPGTDDQHLTSTLSTTYDHIPTPYYPPLTDQFLTSYRAYQRLTSTLSTTYDNLPTPYLPLMTNY